MPTGRGVNEILILLTSGQCLNTACKWSSYDSIASCFLDCADAGDGALKALRCHHLNLYNFLIVNSKIYAFLERCKYTDCNVLYCDIDKTIERR